MAQEGDASRTVVWPPVDLMLAELLKDPDECLLLQGLHARMVLAGVDGYGVTPTEALRDLWLKHRATETIEEKSRT